MKFFLKERPVEIFLENLSDLKNSNLFLRSFWAELRNHFGKCAWLYQPFREGKEKKIYLGTIDIGAACTIGISVRYKQRNSLSAIQFEFGGEPKKDLDKQLKKAVEAGQKNINKIKKFKLKTTIEKLRGNLAPYQGTWFSAKPCGKNKLLLSFEISAFDGIDAETEALKKLVFVVDIFSIETNSLFFTEKVDSESENATNLPKQNIFSRDSWIDDYPMIEQYSLISQYAFSSINKLFEEDLDNNWILFLAACHHYHAAREQDALKNDQLLALQSDGNNLTFMEDKKISNAAKFSRRAEELATVLYISALEVASSIGESKKETCGTCGQQKYGISSRVANFVAKKMPEGGKVMKSIIKDHYNKRSKYLHTGALLSDTSYMGTRIPLLDPRTNSGVTEHFQAKVYNLREWCGYMLRQQMKELIEKKP